MEINLGANKGDARMKTLYELYKELMATKSEEEFLQILRDNKVPEDQRIEWEK
jgi:hypothetical protein